jgi:hypothetical protein
MDKSPPNAGYYLQELIPENGFIHNSSVNSRKTNFIRTCRLALIEGNLLVAMTPDESFSPSLFTFHSSLAAITTTSTYIFMDSAALQVALRLAYNPPRTLPFTSTTPFQANFRVRTIQELSRQAMDRGAKCDHLCV